MRLDSVRAIVHALNQREVRFLVAGGLAVNAYGYLRFTKDADLALELTPANVAAAFDALQSLGYRPLVPVSAEQFGNREVRERLIRDKGMQVLQMQSDLHRETPVDLFATVPFDFDAEWQHATIRDLEGTGPVRFVSIRTLIAMKEAAGRPEDLIDLHHLRMLIDDDRNA